MKYNKKVLYVLDMIRNCLKYGLVIYLYYLYEVIYDFSVFVLVL